MTEPALTPEPGWIDLEIPGTLGAGRSFVSGEPHSDRLRVRYYKRASDGALVGKAWFGPGAEGPPMHAHGGATAAVLDEVMGTACWVAGHPVLAARITSTFRRPLPLGTTALLEAFVERVERRKVFTRARVFGADGLVYAEGEGLYIELSAERFTELVGQPP